MLDKLKEKIEKEGYICQMRAANLLVCGTDNGWSELLDCRLLSNTFSIVMEDETYVLDYTRAQLREVERFREMEELVEFVRKIKPIQ